MDNWLNAIEKKVMELLLKNEAALYEQLREQWNKSTIVSVELTGVGFFINYSVPDKYALSGKDNLVINNKTAGLKDLKNGCGFILFINDGKISTLEGYTYDEPWPENPELTYLT